VNINQPQGEISIEINSKKDLDKISGMKLNLLLMQCQQKKQCSQKKSKHYMVNKTEPLLVYPNLPVKVQKIIPLKKATVKVNLVTVTLIKQELF